MLCTLVGPGLCHSPNVPGEHQSHGAIPVQLSLAFSHHMDNAAALAAPCANLLSQGWLGFGSRPSMGQHHSAAWQGRNTKVTSFLTRSSFSTDRNGLSLHPSWSKWLSGFGQFSGSGYPASQCLTSGDKGWTGRIPALPAAVQWVIKSEGWWPVPSPSWFIIHGCYTQNLMGFFLKNFWLEMHLLLFLHFLNQNEKRTAEGREILEETKLDTPVPPSTSSPRSWLPHLARVTDRQTDRQSNRIDWKKKTLKLSKTGKWKLTQ